MVDRQLKRRRDAAHPEERPELGMDDRAVAAELAEPGLEPDRDVQEIGVADRMFDLAGVADDAEEAASWMTVSPSVK